TLLFLVLSLIYFLLFKLFVCFSTASSRKAKGAASVNLQPLQSNLKVLQEQQTQGQGTTLSRLRLIKFPVNPPSVNSFASLRTNRAIGIKCADSPAIRAIL